MEKWTKEKISLSLFFSVASTQNWPSLLLFPARTLKTSQPRSRSTLSIAGVTIGIGFCIICYACISDLDLVILPLLIMLPFSVIFCCNYNSINANLT